MAIDSLDLFVLASVGLILAPGPDTIYVLTRGVSDGRRAGVLSAAGISTGILVHTLGAVLGLSVLLKTSATAFAAVKYVGALYLVYLGIQTFRDDEPLSIENEEQAGHSYLQGVAINVLNPKVALFFLAFLPQFVDSAAATGQFLALGGIYAVLTLAYLTGIALLSGRVRTLLAARPSINRGLRWVTSSIFVALGLRLAVGGSHT
ncbi:MULTISPECIES: LysE family translocator [unclassified Haladaptatus]|uniref:LysE family translocator n=1 Tax=unclassified Haladaptatus TaxID=2622732 RepID=UPI0023E7A163|nr:MULTISPECIES: LysE family translocator [unclassified Haladaptatus]